MNQQKYFYLLVALAFLQVFRPPLLIAENTVATVTHVNKNTDESFAVNKQKCIDLVRSEIIRNGLIEVPDFLQREAPAPAPEVAAPKPFFAQMSSAAVIPISPIPICAAISAQGDPLIQLVLGFCYREGLGCIKDKDKAEKLFVMAVNRYKQDAEKGKIEAQFDVGYLFAAGEIVPQDMIEARKYFTLGIAGLRKEAEKGNEQDQLKLGRIYADGKLVQQDFAEAVKWYRKAAEKGVSAAQFELGKMFFWGNGVTQDLQEAEKRFALVTGYKYGICSEYIKIAKSYLFGENGLQKDETAANSWFSKAIVIDKYRVGKVLFEIGEKFLVNNKEDDAIKWLDWSVALGSNGLLFSKAREYDTNKNYATAIKLYRILAVRGDVDSQRTLGIWYKHGKNIKQDFSEAEKWLRMAADKGDAMSQTLLGYLYYEGQGVKKNLYLAFDWYKKAADQDEDVALNNLGVMYRDGVGLPKNYAEASKLFKKSAEQGNSSGQWNLGAAFYAGEGITQDKVQALAWLTLAATEEDDAGKFRDSIEKELQPNEVSKAQQLASRLKVDIDKRYQKKYFSSLLDNLPDENHTKVSFFPSLTPIEPIKPAFTPNDIAIIIGIEKYRSVPPTEYAAADAGMVRDYLKALGIPERNIEFLADDRATLSDIRKVIETKLPNMVKANSRVIVYYAGHGAPGTARGESYLVPYDGDPSFLADTAYPLSRLYDRLSRLKAKEVLVILDSCFSGAGGRSVLAKNTRPLVMVKDTPPPASKKMIVMTSSRGSQITTSLSEVGHGAFTYFFLRALQEGNRDIGEVYAYLNPRVTEEAKRQNVDQTPTISPAADKLKGRFLFAR